VEGERGSPRAELVSIGSELLMGETVDTNAAFLGAELPRVGMQLRSARMVPDDRGLIRDAFAEARERSDLVLATGGLGPTHDDVTREALADALGETLTEDPKLRAELEERFRAYGAMPASNLRQAMLVASAEPLPNPIGSAPGWWVDRDGSAVALMPGVPAEMRRMWAEEVRPRVERRFGLAALAVRTVKAFGVGESAAAERLGELLDRPPPGVEAGIYARDDGIHVRFSTRGAPSVLEPSVDGALRALGDDAYGTDDDDLAGAALRALGAHGVETLASWEADTGGAVLAVLAAAPVLDGAARYVGGLLDAGGTLSAPVADALLQVSLLPSDGRGRSHVEVALTGRVQLARRSLRIHGSGPQRLRRAAYAAFDRIRRELSEGVTSSGR
jgi:nicotinamide-nucleotide amidase